MHHISNDPMKTPVTKMEKKEAQDEASLAVGPKLPRTHH